MREITVKLYQFQELDDKAKEKAREWARNDEGMRSRWEFDCIVEDAKRVGLHIDSLNDHWYNEGHFTCGALSCANMILIEHGDKCETYKTAARYVDALKKQEETEELTKEFLHELLEDYRIMLNQAEDYAYSNEAIDEDMQANEYEFTKEGKRA